MHKNTRADGTTCPKEPVRDVGRSDAGQSLDDGPQGSHSSEEQRRVVGVQDGGGGASAGPEALVPEPFR